MYLDWVNWVSYCCKEMMVWKNVVMVGSEENLVGIGMLDVLGKL